MPFCPDSVLFSGGYVSIDPRRVHKNEMSYEPIFERLDIRTTPFALCELQGKCDLGLARRSSATLHYILAGRGEIVIRGHPSRPIGRGSLVLVPATLSHTLRSFGHNGNPVPDCHPAELDLDRHLAGADVEGTKDRLLAICSQVNVGFRGVGELIDLVREPIVEQTGSDATMEQAVDLLLRELSSPRLGSRAMIRALLLQNIIQLLRNRLEAGDAVLGWMAALTDQKLWRALRLMLDRPEDTLSVDSLAATAGLSRSAFSKRFSDAYGGGPMELLRSIRIHRAASLLAESDLPVKRIAQLAGFQSRSAFTRTFEKNIGMAPGAYRNAAGGS